MAHESLERAFNEMRASLVGHLVRLVDSAATAEDLAQEAYLRAAASGNADVEAPKAFLHRTAVNLAVDHLRRQRLHHQIFSVGFDPETAASAASCDPSPERSVCDRQLIARLDAALAAIPPRARQVLVLKRVEGWTYPEIASHFGVSATTVQKDVRLAMAHCAAVLMDSNDP